MIKILKVGKHSIIWQRGLHFVLSSQLWFWADEWQAGERQVDEDIKAGRFQTFENIEDMFASLEADESSAQRTAIKHCGFCGTITLDDSFGRCCVCGNRRR